MTGLKRQIKQLEVDINQNKRKLSQNKALLTQRIASPKFLACAMLGGFALGFLIEHHQTREKISGALQKTPNILKGVNAAMSILSPSLILKLL
jgi:hypothetical protein